MTQKVISIVDLRHQNHLLQVPNTLNTRSGVLVDQMARQLQDLRISVTDHCNFRCVYYLTGGEPLLRNDLERLISLLRRLQTRSGRDLTLTTNGALLDKKARALKNAVLKRINL